MRNDFPKPSPHRNESPSKDEVQFIVGGRYSVRVGPGLTKAQLASILSLYQLDPPDALVRTTRLNSTYWVDVHGRRYVVRVTQGRSLEHLQFEHELLRRLDEQALGVPKLVHNMARGTHTPWARRGRFVSLFEYPRGRPLGRFELRAGHAAQVGAWLGHFHETSRLRRRSCQLPDLPVVVMERLERLQRALDQRRLPRRYRDPIASLARWADGSPWIPSDLPSGPIHAAPDAANARFVNDRLSGFVGFEGAGIGPRLRDLAHGLHEWTWVPEPKTTRGPAGAHDLDAVKRLLEGYDSRRAMNEVERENLVPMLSWLALADATACLVDFELRRLRNRPYRDYRHGLARLRALEASEPVLTRS
ncbi:MAG: phosphotransferase [Myxococcales bacterium]|nr:phosphotransferase [Myxococcales bacterium]